MPDDDSVDSREYLDRAREDPSAVTVEDGLAHLESDDARERKAAADALYELAKDDPERLVEADAVPALVAALGDDDALLRQSVAMALADVAAVNPGALEPHVDALVDHLDDEYDIVPDHLAFVLRCVAGESPPSVADDVPAFLPLLEADLESTRAYVVILLLLVAGERPSAVRPAVEPLLDVLDDRQDPRDRERADRYDPRQDNAEYGDAGAMAHVESGSEVVDDSSAEINAFLCEGVASVLATVAAAQPAEVADTLRPHVPRLVAHLDDLNPSIRAGVVGTLAYVAEYEPEAVEPATEELVDRLDDAVTPVAGNAIWALRYLDTPRSREALREADPDDPDVRAVLDAALDELAA